MYSGHEHGDADGKAHGQPGVEPQHHQRGTGEPGYDRRAGPPPEVPQQADTGGDERDATTMPQATETARRSPSSHECDASNGASLPAGNAQIAVVMRPWATIKAQRSLRASDVPFPRSRLAPQDAAAAAACERSASNAGCAHVIHLNSQTDSQTGRGRLDRGEGPTDGLSRNDALANALIAGRSGRWRAWLWSEW